eukprot:scaffold41363_cov13-Tisochrysis_lutea.AAC.1
MGLPWFPQPESLADRLLVKLSQPAFTRSVDKDLVKHLKQTWKALTEQPNNSISGLLLQRLPSVNDYFVS